MNLSSSSSSQNQSQDKKISNEVKKLSPHCVMLTPISFPPLNFFQTFPFLKQPSNVKPSFELLSAATSQAISQLQSSISSTTDEWFTKLHAFASRNPFLEKLLFFSSQLQNSSQIPFRKYRNLDNLSHCNFAAVLPGDSLAGLVVANGIVNFLNIYNSLLVVRLVLTWFPNAPPVIVSPLSTLCDPYLNIFRGIIPPLGGTLDLSPILAFLLLNAFTSTASALPAELPSTGVSQDCTLLTTGSRATSTQEKWMRRLAANRKSSSC